MIIYEITFVNGDFQASDFIDAASQADAIAIWRKRPSNTERVLVSVELADNDQCIAEQQAANELQDLWETMP